jgi:peptidoglycan/xylan/chitin deacetylase (PgdA/CDA1 family)
MKSKLLVTSFAAFLALAGCSNETDTTPNQSGGSSGAGSGGQNQSGGTSGSGGKVGSGGNTGTGGATSTGGKSGSGGDLAQGGKGAGGMLNTGGGSGEGGSGAGGAGDTGGGTARGGAVGSGGRVGPDASVGAGGMTGSGGATAKGGAGGGTSVTGGTGGGSVVVGASGYPSAGASGQSAPTGAGSKVTVLDWAGFKSAISFTFDDTNQTQIDHYKELQALNDKGNNVRYTFYMQTGKNNEMNSTVWPQAVKDGHEMGNHTKSHQSGANASDIQAAEDTIKSKFGADAFSLAAPNGDASYQTVGPTLKFLMTNRTAGNSGGISPTDDPAGKQWKLPCIIPATNSSASSMESSITSGTNGGKWNIFLVHGFTGGSDGAYQPVSINEFVNTVKWARDQGTMWVDSVGRVSAYWVAEYNFNKLTATTSGSDKTWTWKTSSFSQGFPTGVYLRVKTDGGVLKQGDKVLAWDDHGYYEVSMDAGTLTLSSQ